MANDQYFTASPTAASARREVRLDLPDVTLHLTTDRGVFSADRVDPGTRVLLAESPVPPPSAAHLADVGCGYGPIALTLASRAPDAIVWAIDVNELPPDVRLDGIWSNPPIRIGKAALHELLLHWLGLLAPDAHAWLVVQKHLGADSLARWIDEAGWPTRRIASRQAYRVLEVDAHVEAEP